MAQRKNIKNWRESLQKSIKLTKTGGISTHAAKVAAAAMGGRPAECTITGYCHTLIFEYPGSNLKEADTHQVIYSQNGFTAAIVSDLPAYFEQTSAESLHYSINVALRDGVRSTYEKVTEQANRQNHPKVPLFLVIDEYKDVPKTVLNSGECFSVVENRKREAVSRGGGDDERALIAFKTVDGSWPDDHTDIQTLNVVLAAVKAEQNVTDHIEILNRNFCFVDSEAEAVHPLYFSGREARGKTSHHLDSKEFRDKADRIKSMLQEMMLETEPSALELFDSVLLDKNWDDNYLRLWYLRLWQAIDDSKKHLGHPQLFNKTKVIAGKMTPKKLKEYRDEIAHWHTGKLDYPHLQNLQYTAMELLRRKYQPSQCTDSDSSE